MIQFKLPDIGEGVAEGEIVKWLVAEGDVVAEHQSVVEVMTDKATVEVPAPAAGRIEKILAAEGESVPVGSVIYHLGAEGATAAPAAPVPAAAAPSSGGAMIEFKLPDVGEGVAEGEIVKWLVAEGASVDEHQSVVEVMTDKATVEIPAPAAGVVAKLCAAEGESVPVGSVIYHLQTATGAPAAAAAPAAQLAAGAAPATAQRAATNGKVLAVPSARRVARELNVDLSVVTGTGRNGVVRRADVEAFVAGGGGAAPAAAAAQSAKPSFAPVAVPAGTRETRTPFRGVRRKIAEAMSRSVYTAPHFTVVEEVDVTNLIELRVKAKALGAQQDVKVTFMPFIMKAAALALQKFPMLNGRLDEAAGEIVNFGYTNLGIAMDTPNGLIVPVINEVQAKGIIQLASELGELAGRTRDGKVKADELKGSTFTITNAGNIGGIMATPIINFPDIAILGVHRIRKMPAVIQDETGEDVIAVRSFMNFSISVDHRLADGADGARMLVYLKTLLEDPGLLSL